METKNTTITDVFFDLDHTLWDFEKNSALAFETVFKMQDIKVNMSDFLEFYVPLNLKYWERYRKDEITQNELRFGRLKDAFDLLKFDIDDALVVFLSQQYIHYLPQNNNLFDGTIEILDYLKSKYNLHIITNGFAEVQTKKLNNSYIAKYFKTVTNSEMVGVKKPHRLIFEHALDLAKTKKENSIMIGDCVEADIKGALGAGLDAILFTESKTLIAANIKQISHLSELKNYL